MIKVIYATLLASVLSLPVSGAQSQDIKVRAVRILWNSEIQQVRDAVNGTDACHWVDVTRLKVAAATLDRLSGLKASDNIDWKAVPLDHDRLLASISEWHQWFSANGSRLTLSEVVDALESAEASIRKSNEVP